MNLREWKIKDVQSLTHIVYDVMKNTGLKYHTILKKTTQFTVKINNFPWNFHTDSEIPLPLNSQLFSLLPSRIEIYSF